MTDDDNEETPGARLADFRQHTGLSQRRFAEEIGVSGGLIGSLENGSRLPSRVVLQKLFERYHINSNWLLEGRGPRITPPGSRPSEFAFSEAHTETDSAHQADVYRRGFLPFPYHRLAGTAGVSPVALSRAWLEENDLIPDNLYCVDVPASASADGHGFLALVDEHAERLGGPALWIWKEAGRLSAGDLYWEDNGPLVILPFRAGDKPRVLAGAERSTLAILGRVVWTGRLEA